MSDYPAVSFGVCECGRPGHLVHVILPESDSVHHWKACDGCRTRWYLGTGLFSGWMHDGQHQDQEEWRARSEAFLESYREIEGEPASN